MRSLQHTCWFKAGISGFKANLQKNKLIFSKHSDGGECRNKRKVQVNLSDLLRHLLHLDLRVKQTSLLSYLLPGRKKKSKKPQACRVISALPLISSYPPPPTLLHSPSTQRLQSVNRNFNTHLRRSRSQDNAGLSLSRTHRLA